VSTATVASIGSVELRWDPHANEGRGNLLLDFINLNKCYVTQRDRHKGSCTWDPLPVAFIWISAHTGEEKVGPLPKSISAFLPSLHPPATMAGHSLLRSRCTSDGLSGRSPAAFPVASVAASSAVGPATSPDLTGKAALSGSFSATRASDRWQETRIILMGGHKTT
jgi:hypothetical protein